MFFRCHACSKAFSQAANLTAHARTHSGEKPFRCPVCDRRFSQSSSVTTHMRTHSGERPYRCVLSHYMNYLLYICHLNWYMYIVAWKYLYSMFCMQKSIKFFNDTTYTKLSFFLNLCKLLPGQRLST